MSIDLYISSFLNYSYVNIFIGLKNRTEKTAWVGLQTTVHTSHPDPSSEQLCSISSAEPTCRGTSPALFSSADLRPLPT